MKIFIKTGLLFTSCLFVLAFLLIMPLNAQTSDSPINTTDNQVLPTNTSDNQMLGKLESIAQEGGYITDTETASIPRIVGLIINTLTSILGVIFVILMVAAGFTWMTSSGNEEQIKKATGTIKSATIGLVLTLSAWAIWRFIFDRLIVG